MQCQKELFNNQIAYSVCLKGFLTPEDTAVAHSFLCAQKELSVEGNLLEIGTYQGRFSTLLARHTRPIEQLILVDDGSFGGFDIMMDTVERLHPRAIFIEDHSSKLFDHLVSLENAQLSFLNSFRIIHIDGSHESEAFAHDLSLAHRLLSQNGMIIIDDYFSAQYPQITDIVGTFLIKNPEMSRIVVGFNKAYLCRRESTGIYRKFLLNDFLPLTKELGFDFQICVTNAHTINDEFSPIGIRKLPSYGGSVRLSDQNKKHGSRHMQKPETSRQLRGIIRNSGLL